MAVLDASFLADVDRGHGPATMLLGALVDEGRPLVVGAPSLLAFLSRASDPAKAHAELDARLDLAPLLPGEAARAAALARTLDRKAPAHDALAAAALAILRGEPLVTADADAFEDVPGLDVLTYR